MALCSNWLPDTPLAACDTGAIDEVALHCKIEKNDPIAHRNNGHPASGRYLQADDRLDAPDFPCGRVGKRAEWSRKQEIEKGPQTLDLQALS